MCGAAISEPAVELGGVLELLTTEAWDGDEAGLPVGECGDVAPEFLELRDGENILLACTCGGRGAFSFTESWRKAGR